MTHVLLADDHATLRDALAMLIDREKDMTVVGTAKDGLETLQAAAELLPDVAVIDLSMPGMSGAEVARELHRTRPEVAVIALTRHADEAYVKALLAAGVRGYVLKQSPSTEVLRAVRAVAAGGRYLDPSIEVGQESVARARRARRESRRADLLSAREEQVLRRVACGYSNKEIAAQLEIGVKTVEMHKSNAVRRLGLSGRIDIVRLALLQGWLNER